MTRHAGCARGRRPASVAAQAQALADATHRLHPGDVVCADRGARLETLLGSCVALVFTDPRRTVGAMCHVVHARPALSAASQSTAHGDAALHRMFALLRAKGIEPRLCEAWVFGGGNMFPNLVGADAQQGNVGATNSLWAMDRMDELGVKVLGRDLGGNVYRRLGWTVGPEEPQVRAVPL